MLSTVGHDAVTSIVLKRLDSTLYCMLGFLWLLWLLWLTPIVSSFASEAHNFVLHIGLEQHEPCIQPLKACLEALWHARYPLRTSLDVS